MDCAGANRFGSKDLGRRSIAVLGNGCYMGVFSRIMEGLASEGTEQKIVMIDVKARLHHRFERPAEGI